MKKSQSIIYRITNQAILPALFIIFLAILWQWLADSDLLPSFMLPSPAEVWKAFWEDRSILWDHAKVSLQEAFIGLGIGIAMGFVLAVIMDEVTVIHHALYPIVVVTQTIPSIAIAPLLILWLGYDMTPKIVLIVITTFFPITIALLDGFASSDRDAILLLRSMGAGKLKIFWHIKLPYALGAFFSGLKMSVTYSIVGAVISEWLGGQRGLGVFMTRVRKSFAYDRMFAVIFYISAISLALMLLVKILKWLCMPWERKTRT